jgi:hypothetical protein
MSDLATDKDEKGPNAIQCLSCHGAMREGILHNGIKCIQNHHICVGECTDNFVVSFCFFNFDHDNKVNFFDRFYFRMLC